VAAQVKIGSVSLPPIRKRHLRALWVWVAPVIATLLTSAFGYVRGYAKGLADAAERLAKIETRADALGVREAKVEARMADVETKAESVEDAQAAEAKSNRTERATRDLWHRDDIDAIEQLKKAFRIEGLPKK
jgi:hypothetical protein